MHPGIEKMQKYYAVQPRRPGLLDLNQEKREIWDRNIRLSDKDERYRKNGLGSSLRIEELVESDGCH